MGNFVRFFDAVNLKPLEISQEVLDFYANVDNQQNVTPLRIRIAATHAGKITRNNGFYLPNKMRMGAPSFLDQYPKPIQIHHEDKKDPIGRAVKADYVDISQGFRDSVADSFSVNADKSLQNLVDGRMSFRDAVEFVNKYFINDLAVKSDPDYEGLGYIELIADITDANAIPKILDGRYLTGSVGATTNKAVCSVCKQDWAVDGKCDHRPGKIYDDSKCVIIAGDLLYDEYSFVNKPADRHSRVIEVNINGIQDFVTIDEQSESPIPEITLVVDQSNHSEEDQKMTFKDAFALVSDHEKYKGIEGLEDKVKKLIDEQEDLSEEKLFEILDGDETFSQEEDPVKLFWGDEYEDIVGDDEWGKDYAAMMANEEVKDAKLTAASRKKLPKSVFCKPPDGYPVHDCAHAKSAMAYAKKHDESSSVVACIRRKASRLGCPFKDDGKKKKDSVDTTGQFELGYFDFFSDEEMVQMHTGLLEALKERNIDCSCEPVEDKSRVEELEKELEETKKDNSKERLDAARKEIRYLHSDIENLTNNMANVVEEVRDLHVQRIADLRAFTGKTFDFQAVSDELKEKDTGELKQTIEDLNSKVDMQKIVDTLNSGLSNDPAGTVPDPTLTQDNTKQPKSQEGNEIQVTEELEKVIRLQWLQARREGGQEAADKFLDECKARGIIPNEWPVKDKS